jgi:uncharacterized lipoprotein NlpE involved in copper resistance
MNHYQLSRKNIGVFSLMLLFVGLFGCNNQSTVIQPAQQGCNTTNTSFSSVYAQVLARPGYSEIISMDWPTHQYTFSVNANKTICKIGYQAEASYAAGGKSYEIKIVNASSGAVLYTGIHRFQSNAMDYQTIPPVQLTAGQNYTIKRTGFNFSNFSEMTGTLVAVPFLTPTIFPVSANGFTIVKAGFYDGTYYDDTHGIPKIDIVFQ